MSSCSFPMIEESIKTTLPPFVANGGSAPGKAARGLSPRWFLRSVLLFRFLGGVMGPGNQAARWWLTRDSDCAGP